MLNQNQALESVKSSSHSKNLKKSLVGSFIKSKLYFLMLLTATTGGIVIGDITLLEQVPPAQANPLNNIVDIVQGVIPSGLRLAAGAGSRWVCKGVYYGNGHHIVEIFTEDSRSLVKTFNLPFNGYFDIPPLERGTYTVRIDGNNGGMQYLGVQ